MRTKLLCLCLAALVAGSLVAAPSSAAKKKKKKKAKPTLVVGTDDAGDWGQAVEPQLAPVGEQLGQDLVKATITKADKSTLNFIIEVTSLPPIGGVPESSRYNWDFSVDGEQTQLTGAFTEYLRGVCNPLYNPMICPPPRDPGMSPFFLRRGPCLVGEPCEEIGLTHATFDPGKATITVPVPMKMIGAKPGSVIAPMASSFGPAVYAAPAAQVSSTAAPADTMEVLKTYKVPR